MSDDSQFANRPFSKLAGYILPDRKNKEKTQASLLPEDRELFLREFWRKPPPPKAPSDGFCLGSQCDLSKFIMKKNKKTAPPLPEPAPQEVEEENAFSIAMRNIKPLGGKGRKVPPAKKRAYAVPELPTAEDNFASQLEFALNYSDEYLEGYVVGLDELVLNQLRQGQFSPEAHLDLHGLNAEQAFEALKDFMRQAWFKGLRTVLIVPGRGRNSPAGLGILRQKLPQWLSHEPFKRLVLAFCTAQPHDGGPGSVYALLRRSRKKGPVRWETIAFDNDVF